MQKKQKLELTWIGKENRAKREEQIERVMGATIGMYGDLQEIEGLELKALRLD